MSKREKCPNGTRKNKKTGLCEEIKPKKKRCPPNCSIDFDLFTFAEKDSPKGSGKSSGKASSKSSGKGSAKASKSDSGKSSGKSSGKGSRKASPKSPDDVCSLCLGVIESDKYKTKCEHTFHQKCLGVWCTARDAPKCPYCKADIEGECKNMVIDSIGIIPYLDRVYYVNEDQSKADVAIYKADADRTIQRYLNNPTFNPNVQDENGRTPLHHAVRRDRRTVIDQLLSRKDINTDILDNTKQLAVEVAIHEGSKYAVNSFLRHRKVPEHIKDNYF
jgi:hypothetical protein